MIHSHDEPVKVLHIEGLSRQPIIWYVTELIADNVGLAEAPGSFALEIAERAMWHGLHPLHFSNSCLVLIYSI